MIVRDKVCAITTALDDQIAVAKGTVSDEKDISCKLIKKLCRSYRHLGTERVHIAIKAIKGTVDFTSSGIKECADRNFAISGIKCKQFQ